MERELAALNFNQLYYFHVVAQEGSLAAAAKKLAVTQSTLSEQIKSIEAALDEQLFDRKGGRLRLNEAGRHAMDHTQVMFREAERLVRHLRGSRPDGRMTLDVGVTSGVARSVAARAFLPIFGHENVRSRVRFGDYDYLLHALVSHDLDLLISENAPSDPGAKGIRVVPLHRPQLQLVATPELAARIGEVPGGLENVPCVLYSVHSKYRWDIDRYLADGQTSLDVIAEVDDVALQLAMATKGMAAAFLPKRVCRDAVQDRSLRVLDELPDAETTISALYAEKTPAEIVTQTVEALAGHFSSE